MGYSSLLLAKKQQEIDYASNEKTRLDHDLTMLEEDWNRIEALDDWNRGGIVWLDEFYDLTSRFPDTDSIRLTSLAGAPLRTARRPSVSSSLRLGSRRTKKIRRRVLPS